MDTIYNEYINSARSASEGMLHTETRLHKATLTSTGDIFDKPKRSVFQSINQTPHSTDGFKEQPARSPTSEVSSGSSVISNKSEQSTDASSMTRMSIKGTLQSLQASVNDQLQNINETFQTATASKSSHELLIKYLHRKIEQDAELSGTFIDTMERIVKWQADAQAENVKILQKCSELLENVAQKCNTPK